MGKIINSVPLNNKTASGSQTAIIAKYAEDVKMDGKLSDPAWLTAPEYHFELPVNAYSKEPESLRKSLGDRDRGWSVEIAIPVE